MSHRFIVNQPKEEKKSTKMKMNLAFLAVFAVFAVAVHGTPTRDIHTDLRDFIDLIPKDEIVEIYRKHLEDPALQEAVEYIRSDEFKDGLHRLEHEPETRAILDDLETYELNAYDAINQLNDLLGLPHISVRNRQTRSLKSLISDVIEILPKRELQALFQEKMETKPHFRALMEHFVSSEFLGLVADLRALPDFQIFEEKLAKHDVYLENIWELLSDILGWDF